METQIKRTVKSGNSSAVILPRSWLDKEVKVELLVKNNLDILQDVLQILEDKLDISNIIGVYLVGSYARGEETLKSDIDILVITKDVDLSQIEEDNYSILVVSESLLKQKIREDILPVGQMIIEAKTLLNEAYLSSINIKVNYENTKWYFDTTRDKINLIKKIISRSKINVSDKVIYTLILRLRSLYIIEKMVASQMYSTRDFINLVKEISGNDIVYNSYLNIKSGKADTKSINIKVASKLVNYLSNYLQDVKKLIRKR